MPEGADEAEDEVTPGVARWDLALVDERSNLLNEGWKHDSRGGGAFQRQEALGRRNRQAPPSGVGLALWELMCELVSSSHEVALEEPTEMGGDFW
jgi:hypothetical protein